MAERTSTRTANRRTTPQPNPGTTRVAALQGLQKRTPRSTRSRSHGTSENEGVRAGATGRRGTQQGASDGPDSTVGKSNAKGRQGRPAAQDRALQDLSTVQEDPSVVYPNILTGEDDADRDAEGEENLQQSNPQASKSPGGVSAFSGTTARTSLSVQGSADLDAESMLDALPDLVEAADKLLGLLMPAELSEVSVVSVMTRLHMKGSRESRNWRRLGNTFQAQRDLYGSDSYINPLGAMRILLGTKRVSELSSGPWRPDTLLQKANLAVLASSILSQPWQEQADRFIEELEEIFPRPFTEALVPFDTLTPGTSALALETVQYALEVRTQYAIMLLARVSSEPDLDWDVVMQQTFFRDEKTLKGWGVTGLRSEDLTEDATLPIVTRVGQVREAFETSPKDPDAAVERLRINFPWTTFASQTIAWINLRSNEVEAQIASSGGTEAICQGLNDKIQKNRSAKTSINDDNNDERPQLELHYEPPSKASHTAQERQEVLPRSARTKLNLAQFSRNSPIARGAAATLKRRMKQTSMQNAPPPGSHVQVTSTAETSAQPVTPQRKDRGPAIPSSASAKIQEDGGRSQATGGDEQLFLSQESDHDPYASCVLALRDQQEKENNKENIVEVSEPQRRLIDPQMNAERIEFDSPEPSSNRQASQIDNLSDDVEFQQQHLPPDAGHRRHLKPAIKRAATEPARSQGSPKKVRMREISGSQGLDGGRDGQLDGPPASQIDEYIAANAAAKERKAWQVKPPQVRKAWTEKETERLLDLIEEHGTSWKLLKHEDFIAGHVLASRDQVALKDKARNMKMDYLKSSRILPPNFDRIPLSKPHIDRLRGVGIQYDPETGQRVDAFVDEDE
ncbi:hypothetical protein N7G274_004038 [Stereocaulon virgatum]|uniref:Myb-like domain-containing protein n=1 Tax=Stereocaulon virgatum TaxID=373712 RepID=A0ABR4AB34_9LECA